VRTGTPNLYAVSVRFSDQVTDDIKCRVRGVFMTVNELGAAPTVVLEVGEYGSVPIYVGLWEAISINNTLKGSIPARPFTHDLIIDLLGTFGITLDSVHIDSIENGVFYAKLSLRRGDSGDAIDCRPSDGIALALRADVPVFIDPAVVRETAVKTEELSVKMVDLDSYL